MQTKDPIRYLFHKQQRRGRRRTQTSKLTTQKMTKMRLAKTLRLTRKDSNQVKHYATVER